MAKLITDQNYYTPNWISGKTPSNPQHGDVWFDTTEKKLKVFRNQENLLKYSENLLNPVWIRNVFVTESGTGITSNYKAFILNETSTTTNGVLYQDVLINIKNDLKIRTFSLDIKKLSQSDSRQRVGVAYYDNAVISSHATVDFNILNGDIVNITSTPNCSFYYTILLLNDDWCRVLLSLSDSGQSSGVNSLCRCYVYPALSSLSESAVGNILISRPQLSEESKDKQYIKTENVVRQYKKWYYVNFNTSI